MDERIKLISPDQKFKNSLDIIALDSRAQFVLRLRHLIHSRADDPDLATHGIDVRSFQLTGNELKDKTVDIMAWDFAGQKEYYNIHDKFVSDQAVYLLVWDVTQESDKSANNALLDWFRMIRENLPASTSMYKNAAVIVIGTHVDLLPPDQRSDEARKNRDNYVRRTAKKAGLNLDMKIEEICATNTRESSDITKLVESIYVEAATLAGEGKIVANEFLNIEKVIDLARSEAKKTNN